MAITSIKTGSSFTNLVKYNDFLGPNAAYNPSSYESIASATGTGSSATITFGSIPSTYASLQIRINGKGASNYNGTEFVVVTANGDTGTNYTYHGLQGYGTGVQAYGYTAQNYMALGNIQQSGTSNTDIMSGVIIDVHNYASTTQNKTFRSISGSDRNGSGGSLTLSSGLWINTNAISSITLVNNVGNWTTQTTIALYGIKGA